MKKTKVLIVFCLICMFLSSCGDVSDVKVIQNPSDMYTQKEIDSAIKVAKNYFYVHFNDCKLTEIAYSGDEITKAHTEFATRHNADEVIVLDSTFEVGASGGDGSLNPNDTYGGWKWILVRNGKGKWRHVDHGY